MSKRRQPQRLPPPLMHGAEAIDSEVILREFPNDLGLLLWKTVRSVRVWSELADGDRGKAFGASAQTFRSAMMSGSEVPEEIAGHLTKAATVLMPRARAASVAGACRAISDWCVEQGQIGTAVEFMQAAAVLVPLDAELAHDVAKLARTRTDYSRAETWYRQAISRARRGAVWSDFSRSYIGMGIVFRLRGSYPQARSSLIRGLRAAKRFSIRPLVAAAYHELAVLAIHAEKSSDVIRYASLAVNSYAPGSPRLSALANDFAAFLMTEGRFKEALRTFVALPNVGGSAERLSRVSAIVQTAGAVRDAQTYATAWEEAELLLEEAEASSVAIDALLAMARGAASMGEHQTALRKASLAKQTATARGEFAGENEAEVLLASLNSPVTEEVEVTSTWQTDAVNEVVERFETALAAAGSD